MKTDRKISDILWDAANKYLCPPGVDSGDELWMESCCAVAEAENGHDRCNSVDVDPDVSKALAYLQEFGVNPREYGQFADVGDSDEEIQGARYLWLMFAYQVALSEGV